MDRAVRLFTSSYGILSNQEFDRLIHLVEVGTGRLAEDVDTFKAAAEKGDTPMHTANAMSGMAETFQSYVDEGTELAYKLRASRDSGMVLSIGGYEVQETAEALAEVEETVREEVEAHG